MERETIILESLRRDLDAAVRRSIRQVQESVTKLQEFSEWECPKTIHQVNFEEFKRQIAPRIEAVKADLSLTEGERAERLKNWHALSMRFAKVCKPVEEALDEFPELEWTFFEANNNFIPKSDLDELVERRCTRELPPMAKTHYRLIQQAKASVEVLRDWEERNNVKCMPLAALITHTIEQLAEGYLNETIFNSKYTQRIDGRTQKRLII